MSENRGELLRLRKGEGLPTQTEAAYRFLDGCIRGSCGLIFSASAPLDWVDGSATLESVREIAAVVDSAAFLCIFDVDSIVWICEVLDACRRQDASLIIPHLEFMHVRSSGGFFQSPLAVLSLVPGWREEHQLPELPAEDPAALNKIPLADFSVRLVAERALHHKQTHPDTYRERVDGYQAALKQDIETASTAFGSPQRVRDRTLDGVAWMKRYLGIDRILEHYNPRCHAQKILERVDLRSCPAVSLWLSARRRRIRAAHRAKDNEVDDWMFLPVIPYADLMLADKGLVEFVRQSDPTVAAHVAADPNQASKILSPWLP